MGSWSSSILILMDVPSLKPKHPYIFNKARITDCDLKVEIDHNLVQLLVLIFQS